MHPNEWHRDLYTPPNVTCGDMTTYHGLFEQIQFSRITHTPILWPLLQSWNLQHHFTLFHFSLCSKLLQVISMAHYTSLLMESIAMGVLLLAFTWRKPAVLFTMPSAKQEGNWFLYHCWFDVDRDWTPDLPHLNRCSIMVAELLHIT